MKITDKNNKELNIGDIFDLHQTVNGENLFVVFCLEPLDIRYAFDLNYKYQYDLNELFEPCRYSGEVYFEIVGNIYSLIKPLRNYI